MSIRRQGNSLLASELDLIQQLMAGKSVRAIAQFYERTPQRITARVKRIMQISGAKNHFQLGVWARDNGYVEAVVKATNGPTAATVNPVEQHGSAA